MISSVLLSIHLGFYNNIIIQKCIFLHKYFHTAFIISLKQKPGSIILDQHVCIFLVSLISYQVIIQEGRAFHHLHSHRCVELLSHISLLYFAFLWLQIKLERILNTFWEVCFVNSNFIVFILYFTFFFLLNSSVPQAAINLFFFLYKKHFLFIFLIKGEGSKTTHKLALSSQANCTDHCV